MKRALCILLALWTAFQSVAAPFPFCFFTTTSLEDPSATSLTNFTCYWKLDETSGTRNDSSANAQHLTDNNTVTYAAGIKGNAASFASASSEYLSRADSATLSTGDIDWAVAFWVKPATIPSGASMTPICKDDNNGVGTREWLFSYRDTFTRYVLFQEDATVTELVDSSTLFVAGTWYFVVCEHDATANTITIQVNNGSIVTTTYTTFLPTDSTASFYMGKRGGGTPNYYNGLEDEVWFGKRKLTTAERTYLYNSGSGRTYNSGTGKFE